MQKIIILFIIVVVILVIFFVYKTPSNVVNKLDQQEDQGGLKKELHPLSFGIAMERSVEFFDRYLK